MRKIIVLNRITLDGVLQAPTRPAAEEDPGDNFPYGGWTIPYADDVLRFRKRITPHFHSGRYDEKLRTCFLTEPSIDRKD